MKKRLLVLVFMLFSVVALNLPLSTDASSTSSPGFCELCSAQCVEESKQVESSCRSNGGTAHDCEQQRLSYNWACHSTFCPSCTVYYD